MNKKNTNKITNNILIIISIFSILSLFAFINLNNNNKNKGNLKTETNFINDGFFTTTITFDIKNEFYLQKDFTYYYFLNLNNNYVTNSFYNCTYTALSMLLSYYDTYWNDNFIIDTYESNKTKLNTYNDETINEYSSPGINDNTIRENHNYLNSYYENNKIYSNCSYCNYKKKVLME